jgi:AcrR family transcriptional regulator
MDLILNHAEAEFAAKGYNGTTLASVAMVAGVDTALMRYYFGDKEKLFAAVFRRRGPAVADARRKALAEYRTSAGETATLEGLIDAFVRPTFEIAMESERHRNYAAIVSYVNSSRGPLHALMADVFDEMSHLPIDDMRRLMPGVPEERIYWSYHFLTGTLTFSLGRAERVDRISGGAVCSNDLAAMADDLPVFAAAAIRALRGIPSPFSTTPA